MSKFFYLYKIANISLPPFRSSLVVLGAAVLTRTRGKTRSAVVAATETGIAIGAGTSGVVAAEAATGGGGAGVATDAAAEAGTVTAGATGRPAGGSPRPGTGGAADRRASEAAG